VTSEWDFFHRARRGDDSAWRILTEKYQNRLTALVLMITESGAATDDIVQETFYKALTATVNNRRGTVSGYLGTIAYRLAVKESLRLRRLREISEIDFSDNGSNPLENMLVDERDRLVATAIRKLDDEHRDVLLLRFYGGNSYEEMAELLSVPLGTIKSRLFYAVRRCRKLLKDKGVI